jgi:hypothetical protein
MPRRRSSRRIASKQPKPEFNALIVVVSGRTAVIDLITRVVSEGTAVIDLITRVVSEGTAVMKFDSHVCIK